MKISFNLFSVLLVTAFLAIAGIPQRAVAQRFNHGGGGGSRGGGVSFHPSPSPAFRPTISGGARNNMGAHNFNRPAPAAPVNRPQVNPRPAANANVRVNDNRNVHANVTVRENVNVYHGGNRGGRSFAYHPHPYHPHYWGPRWHPVGFFLSSLAADAYFFSLANQRYYYDDGVYYSPYNNGYSVVPAPIGAVVSSLPDGYESLSVGDDYFYYYGGTFYINNGQGYQVVAAPVGAVVTEVPDGATEQQINDQDLLVYNNTYFLPISQNGQNAYQVVQVN